MRHSCRSTGSCRQDRHRRGSVVDIQINLYHQTKACGDFADPGTHLLLGDHAAAIEVGNDYFRLERLSP